MQSEVRFLVEQGWFGREGVLMLWFGSFQDRSLELSFSRLVVSRAIWKSQRRQIGLSKFLWVVIFWDSFLVMFAKLRVVSRGGQDFQGRFGRSQLFIRWILGKFQGIIWIFLQINLVVNLVFWRIVSIGGQILFYKRRFFQKRNSIYRMVVRQRFYVRIQGGSFLSVVGVGNCFGVFRFLRYIGRVIFGRYFIFVASVVKFLVGVFIWFSIRSFIRG